jgi:PhzF family phenazine biosynthesis protein
VNGIIIIIKGVVRMVDYLLVDAFTNIAGQGNRAGVVLDAQKYTTEQMQEIALMINVSETAFIVGIEKEKIKIRYFSPLKEVPICGHATIASFYALLSKGLIKPGLYKLDCMIGLIDIIVTDDQMIGMIVSKVEKLKDINQYQKELLDALNLEKNDIENIDSLNIYSTGNPKLIIELKDEHKLNSLDVNKDKLIALSKKIDCSGFHVLCVVDGHDALVSSRMFAPAIGIDEDPVTGNSVGCIIQYLFDQGYPIVKLLNCRFKQGQAINKTGYIDVSCNFNGMAIDRISYYGDAVLFKK